MIISRTPLRISFVGGGSDMPSFYRATPGAVVTSAINKYIYITVNKKFDKKIRASYSRTEIVENVNDLQHELVRECLNLVKINSGIEITSISDIPSEGTGLGSSSSYVVGLLNALYAYKGMHVTAEHLAREACKIEIEKLKKPIGKQDQYIAAYGGFQYMQFNRDGTIFVDPIISLSKTKKTIEKKLLLLYTGITRSANQILEKQNENIKNKKKYAQKIQNMVHLAKKMRTLVNENQHKSFGLLLEENWNIKKTMADGITSEKIEKWYMVARVHGAKGGKILGAGGGGFLLLYADEKDHKKIIKALPELNPVKFSFEPQGSKIIFVSE